MIESGTDKRTQRIASHKKLIGFNKKKRMDQYQIISSQNWQCITRIRGANYMENVSTNEADLCTQFIESIHLPKIRTNTSSGLCQLTETPFTTD